MPALAERGRFLERWNVRLDETLRFAAPTIAWCAERSEGFSFAYLKELVLSVLTRSMDRQDASSAELAREVVAELVDQLDRTRSAAQALGGC